MVYKLIEFLFVFEDTQRSLQPEESSAIYMNKV